MLVLDKKLSSHAILSLSGLIAASDQGVKWIVQQSMGYGESLPVTPFLKEVLIYSTAALKRAAAY